MTHAFKNCASLKKDVNILFAAYLLKKYIQKECVPPFEQFVDSNLNKQFQKVYPSKLAPFFLKYELSSTRGFPYQAIMNIVIIATNEEGLHDNRVTTDSSDVIWQLVDFMSAKSRVNTMLTYLVR